MTPLLAQRPRTDRAFERLYQRYAGDVYRYTLALLRNPADAEDVTQTTFLNAYRAFQRGEQPRKPQNWLITIAHNVCRQRFRQSARRPQEVEFAEELSESPPEDDGPTAADIRRALGHLAFNQRAALVMRELEDRSYAEIAEVLSISVSAVETLIFRARRALREQLEGGLTCHEAELAISRQLDGRLPRAEHGSLRAHVRECADCATLARSQRAQRSAWKALGAVPLPSSLSSFFGGSAAVGTGVALKAAAIVAAGAVIAGLGYEGAQWTPWTDRSPVARAALSPATSSSAAASRASQRDARKALVGRQRNARRGGGRGGARPGATGASNQLTASGARGSGPSSVSVAPAQSAAGSGVGAAASAGVASAAGSVGSGATQAQDTVGPTLGQVETAVQQEAQNAVKDVLQLPTPSVSQQPAPSAPAPSATAVDATLTQVEQAVAQTVEQAVKDVPSVPSTTTPTIPTPPQPPTVSVPK